MNGSFDSWPMNDSTRSFISLAALLVNVSAIIDDGSVNSLRIRCEMREVITLVFPDPAPAMTMIEPFLCVTACRCCSLRFFFKCASKLFTN